jgi:HlyD family secretion protein
VIRNTDPIFNFAPMSVSSTVDGVVSKVEVTEGSRVQRGDKLLLVTDPEQVRVAVEVTSLDVGFIKPGLAAELRIPGLDKVLALKVKGISPFVDPATGTASCELELANRTNKKGNVLPPLGVIGRVYFRVNIRKGISISDSAITYRGKDPYVRTVVEGKAKLVPVVMGRKEAGFVEILKGLKDGDQVIERSSSFVADGEAVEVQTKESEPSKNNQGKG